MLTTSISMSASPELRDRFLDALDACDRTAIVEVATRLTGCSNLLPATTCLTLGLPRGSRYSDAAARVLTREATNLVPAMDLRSLVRLAKSNA